MVCTIFLATNVVDEPVFWAIVGAGLGVYLFVRGFRILQRKRLLLNTPESKIRSASMGLVEINGQAVGPYTMLAPASQFECFYYHTIAWQLKQSGKSKEWVKVAEESLHLPFFIDDGTGRLLVDCNGAETDLHRDFHEQYNHSFFSSNDSVPDGVYQFLARHGVSNDHDLKVDEYCIKPKNFLFVLGTLAENPGLKLTAMPQHTLSPGMSVSFHLPGSGSDVTRTVSLSLGNSPSSALQITASKVVTELMPPGQAGKWAGADPQLIAQALIRAGITNPQAWAAAGVNPATAHVQVAQINLENASSSPSGTPAAPQPHAGPLDQQTIADALRKAGIASPRAWAAAGIGNPGAFLAQTPSAPAAGSEIMRVELGNMPPAANAPLQFARSPYPAGASAGTAVSPALQPSVAQSTPSTDFDLHPKTVLMRGENDRAFFISWRSQKEVIASLGWKSTLYIWGGPLLLLLSAYVLLARFSFL